jgi:hypothetical protein
MLAVLAPANHLATGHARFMNSQNLAQMWMGTSGLAFVILAFGSAGWPAAVFVGAAASVLGIVPYTLVVMRGMDGRLMELAEGAAEAKGESTLALVRRWGALSLGRGLLSLLAVGLGLLAMWGSWPPPSDTVTQGPRSNMTET